MSEISTEPECGLDDAAGAASSDPSAVEGTAVEDGAVDVVTAAGAVESAGEDGAPADSSQDDLEAPAAASRPGVGGRSSRRSIEPGQLEREGDIAADYLEGLLDIADLDGDIDMDVETDRAAVSIVGGDLSNLVGRNGEVLEALQELTRLAVQAQTGDRSRLMLDVAGHRAARRTELTALGTTTAQQVAADGTPVRLAPMTPFERKVVHDAVAASGLRSESEGEEPQRRVVVLPAE